jgi:hypothetical protein
MAVIDQRLDRLFEEMRGQREEMRVGFADIRGELERPSRRVHRLAQ